MTTLPGKRRAAGVCVQIAIVLSIAPVLWAPAAALDAPNAANAPLVPLVVCPLNEEPGSGTPAPAPSMAAAVDTQIAEGLAYYGAPHSPGVYAPKRWHCRAWYGSTGSILLVTPKAIAPPYYPLPAIDGPAVLLQSFDRSSTGRFHIALVAAQLFPVVGSEFIAGVRAEHLIADSAFDATPYPDDELQYLSDRLVQFTTPADRSGLGTDSMLESSGLPVRGLVMLNLGDESNSLTELRVRLPAALSAAANALIQLETSCLQLRGGCRTSLR